MATKFSLTDPNPGVWFKFDESDPESGEIRIRVLNSLKREEIQKICIKNRDIYKNGQRYVTTDTNDSLFSELLWDYCIVEWTGLEDEEGKTLTCDTDTKIRLMRENVGFSLFVGRCLELLNVEEDNRVAMIEKNSLSGSSESRKNRIAKSAKP